jgi:hypothetical protein
MSGSFTLNGWEDAMTLYRERAIDAVGRAAASVRDEARQRAPKRKAFYNNKGRYKKKTSTASLASFSMKIKGGRLSGAEIMEAAGHLGIDLSPQQMVRLRRRPGDINSGSSAEGNALRELRPRPLLTRGGQRQVGFYAIGKGAAKRMNARARYDIRTSTTGTRGGNPSRNYANRNRGRGVITFEGPKGGTRYQYGGFLKKSIVVDNSDADGDQPVSRVRSMAPYSRYVEFPTSRTAAQPYLLPAFKGLKGRYATYFRKRRG